VGAAGFIDGPRVSARFSNPVNIAVRGDGNIYVADFDNGAVRVITPEGTTTTLVKQANFSRPFGMVFTPTDELYVQTDRNSLGADLGALWRIDLGTGFAALVLDDVGRARGLASLSDGRLVLADSAASSLRIYNPASQSLSNLAGQPNAPGFADGTGAAARFNRPMDLLVTGNNEIYVADSENHRIRHVTLSGVVTTLAGSGVRGSADGPLLAAMLDTPIGLAIDSNANLFVSEFDSGRIRKIENTLVKTVAGSDQGFADNSDPLLARLFTCEGLAYEAPYLYLADGNGGTDATYNRVRRLDLGD
jgi:sugar lactone lactonase YvrE